MSAEKDPGGTGGNITLTGYDILLDATTSLDVSGDLGGGTVLVGGNNRGSGPLPNANQLIMMPSATINANAITNGNGGNVVLWSNQGTQFTALSQQKVAQPVAMAVQ